MPLPRRMWAGSRLAFPAPLRIGDAAVKTSTVRKVEAKAGKTGPLVFVTVGHQVSVGGRTAIEEEHDIVYRENAPPGAPSPPPQPAPADAAFERTIRPDPVLLFRYSALTFNSHRIHYDQPYVTGVEGYPGLIVHGPLIATLLLDNLRRAHPDRAVRSFAFRAVSPCSTSRLSPSRAGLPRTAARPICGRNGRTAASPWRRPLDWAEEAQAIPPWEGVHMSTTRRAALAGLAIAAAFGFSAPAAPRASRTSP